MPSLCSGVSERSDPCSKDARLSYMGSEKPSCTCTGGSAASYSATGDAGTEAEEWVRVDPDLSFVEGL